MQSNFSVLHEKILFAQICFPRNISELEPPHPRHYKSSYLVAQEDIFFYVGLFRAKYTRPRIKYPHCQKITLQVTIKYKVSVFGTSKIFNRCLYRNFIGGI